jgi:hypothetical protein
MKPELITLIGTLSGAIVGFLGSIAITWIRSKTEERKHQRELIFQAGIENYRQAFELTLRQGGELSPIEDFLINMAKFFELFKGNKIDSTSIERHLKEMDELNKKISEFRDKQSKVKKD